MEDGVIKSFQIMNGLPTFIFSEKEIANMSTNFGWIGVSKFPIKRPTMDDVRLFFISLGFAGAFQVGRYDQKHILIRFTLESDFNRVRRKGTYYIENNIPIKIWKWEPCFKPGYKSPVWLEFPDLPIKFWPSQLLT
ncbi:hypothetical protein AXF42_Ash004430 [Apostasia shenzhenica]|uniref:DUF4283 domain-containing protein n=1 Tax=Apostasia shenzhenica TaxID=1088818 RepID=A0A2I0A2X7_9ASPA|nr:hypothetical protein AXF42_Ash004430 [Apostasia shenzhenica]